MTPVQIAYFKHFLFDKGISRTYIHMYQRHRIKGTPEGDKKGNPDSLEEFLMKQPLDGVLTQAFYFPVNSDYGFDYWSELSNQWKSYWEMHENNFSNNKYIYLKGTFGILKQNWDKKQYWIVETPEETYKRMGIEPPLDTVDNSKNLVTTEGKKFQVGDIIKGSISGEFRKVVSLEKKWYVLDDGSVVDYDKQQYWSIVEQPDEKETDDYQEPVVIQEEPEEPEKKEEAHSIGVLDGFSLVEPPHVPKGKRNLVNKVSVNLRNHGHRITLPAEHSGELFKHGYTHVQFLVKAETREVALIFNHSQGYPIGIKKGSDTISKNTVINSMDLVKYIQEFYGLLKEDYFHLAIVSSVQQKDSTVFILKYEK